MSLTPHIADWWSRFLNTLTSNLGKNKRKGRPMMRPINIVMFILESGEMHKLKTRNSRG